jgi:replicative DNA helicase
LVKQAIDTIKSLKDKEGLSGVPSGFRDVDKETGGWQNSDLIIIAARPAMGKTAFLLSMARNIAVGHKIPMALFSLEMASVQLITRMIASETRISSEKLRKGTLMMKNGKDCSPMFLNWKMLLYILTKHLHFPFSTSVQNAEDLSCSMV